METNILSAERPVSTADLAREMNAAPTPPPPPAQQGSGYEPLLPRDITDKMNTSWTDIQAGFVDEPRRAVQQADELVATAIKHIAETFARERQNLEGQWDREGEVSTEDLRVALTRYRSFFHRLLSM